MTGHIFIEGDIGEEVTSKTVRADIAQYPNATNFIVHINSGGGDVYEGYQIGSILKNLGKPTVAHIGAVCASIATYAACSCDSVVMSPAGIFMIHMPTGNGISGTSDELRRAAGQLDQIKTDIINRYLPKVASKGVTREKLAAMMAEETYMTPTEAMSLGFVDNVQEKLKAAARIDVNKFAMKEPVTKDEVKGMFDSFAASLSKVFSGGKVKFKNAVTLTLEDGRIVMVMAENEDAIVGQQVALEDGTPLPAGQYPTQDGQVLTVDAGSKITEATPTMAQPTDEVAKLKEENAALKQQIEASAKASEENVQKEVAKVTAQFKTQFSNMQKQFDELKAKTFGEEGGATTEADNGKGQKFTNEQRPYDPMAANLWPVVQSRYTTNFEA